MGVCVYVCGNVLSVLQSWLSSMEIRATGLRTV